MGLVTWGLWDFVPSYLPPAGPSALSSDQCSQSQVVSESEDPAQRHHTYEMRLEPPCSDAYQAVIVRMIGAEHVSVN